MQNRLKTFGLVLLAVAILWWFGRRLDLNEVRSSMSHANWTLLLAAAALTSFTYVVRTYRWRALLKPLASPGLRDLFIANVVGFSAFFLLGRAGEVVRPALLPVRDRRVRPAASFLTIFVERICDFVAIVLLFGVNLAWFRSPVGHELDFANVRTVGLLLLGAVVAGVAALIIFERLSGPIIGWLNRGFERFRFVPKRLVEFILSTTTQLVTALSVLSRPREVLVTTTWTMLLWFIIILSNLLIMRAFGLAFGFRETVFVVGWALVGSLVPTPGGAAGAFHAAAAAGLIFVGVKPEHAAAVAILIHLVDFAPALLFGGYYLIRGEFSVGRLRELQLGNSTSETLGCPASTA